MKMSLLTLVRNRLLILNLTRVLNITGSYNSHDAKLIKTLNLRVLYKL